MGEVRLKPLTKQFRLQCRGWTEVKLRPCDTDEHIERINWCEVNAGPRDVSWDAVHLKYFYFARRHHALMFKLAFGGR